MRTLSVVPFLLLAGALPVLAQQQTFTAGKIQFTNRGPYSQVQLEAAAGMHAGTKFTAEDLSAAAQRLADTGYLGEVGAKTLPGRTDAITVEFEITPIPQDQMLHVVFENFVWLTPAEINAALQAKAPLFDGYVPENNDLLEAFNAALTEALAKKGVTAKVMHDAFEPSLQRPEIDVDYWVANPPVRVAEVHLSGVSTELAPLVQKSVNSVAGKAYSGGLPGGSTEGRILAPLLNAGYINASLSDVTLTPAVSQGIVSLSISAELHAGDVYRVASISFAGSPLLTEDAFATTEKIHAGDIADRSRLLETLMPLDTAYRRAGYADVIVRADPKEEDAAHQVTYTVTVSPGEQYRIKTVMPNGLDATGQAAFDKEFAMKPGDIYDPEYVKDFLKHNTVVLNQDGPGFSYKAYADPGTHTVDLVLNFGGIQQNVTVFGGQ